MIVKKVVTYLFIIEVPNYLIKKLSSLSFYNKYESCQKKLIKHIIRENTKNVLFRMIKSDTCIEMYALQTKNCRKEEGFFLDNRNKTCYTVEMFSELFKKIVHLYSSRQ